MFEQSQLHIQKIQRWTGPAEILYDSGQLNSQSLSVICRLWSFG